MSYISRVEQLLMNILGTDVQDVVPQSRVEHILRAIASESDSYGVPLSRVEKLLQKWNGDNVTLETPQSRIEKLLYKIVGEDITVEPPLSRIEELLTEIAENTDTTLNGLIFDGDCWFEIPILLTGDDILRFTYSARINCNVLGSYVDSSADNNFSYYHGATVYARYGNQLNRVNASVNTEYTIAMGYGGFDIDDAHYSFDPSEFVCETNLMIGRLPNSTQPKLKGYLAGPVVVDGRLNLVPVITKEGEIGYRDRISGEFYANMGSGTLQPYE